MTLTLLLVEDHQMTRVGLKLILEQNPGIVICGEANTGLKAIDLVAEHQPNLVLMDIGMPDMDGIEATQIIKQKFPNTRVLMLTSKDDARDVMAAMGAGADGYCMKGIDSENLCRAIQAVAEGTVWLDRDIARIVLSAITPTRPIASDQPTLVTQTVRSITKTASSSASTACPLTERELEVLHLIVEGDSNPQIADKLYITTATAKAHVHSILQKLCVDDRTQAAVLAMRQGYIPTHEG